MRTRLDVLSEFLNIPKHKFDYIDENGSEFYYGSEYFCILATDEERISRVQEMVDEEVICAFDDFDGDTLNLYLHLQGESEGYWIYSV